MNPTGLLFAALAAVWLGYLIPLFLNRKENGIMDEVEPGEPFSASVTIVRRGNPLDSAENGTAVVSTPLNRRAALRELADIDREAARRRRNVLAFLVTMTVIVAVLSGVGLVSWWTLAVPVALIGGFLAVARFTVTRMRRDLKARAQVVRGGDAMDEPTIGIPMLEPIEDDNEVLVELSSPVEASGSLWDPIPITAPTYVSRPLAPRTVRTVDLSAPAPATSSVPVTAELPEGTHGLDAARVASGASVVGASDEAWPRAVGE